MIEAAERLLFSYAAGSKPQANENKPEANGNKSITNQQEKGAVGPLLFVLFRFFRLAAETLWYPDPLGL